MLANVIEGNEGYQSGNMDIIRQVYIHIHIQTVQVVRKMNSYKRHICFSFYYLRIIVSYPKLVSVLDFSFFFKGRDDNMVWFISEVFHRV